MPQSNSLSLSSLDFKHLRLFELGLENKNYIHFSEALLFYMFLIFLLWEALPLKIQFS